MAGESVSLPTYCAAASPAAGLRLGNRSSKEPTGQTNTSGLLDPRLQVMGLGKRENIPSEGNNVTVSRGFTQQPGWKKWAPGVFSNLDFVGKNGQKYESS